jgi:polyisoprenoid-binding protein YceI
MATYTIDTAHSRIGFAVKHMVISTVRGQFHDFTSTVNVDEANPHEAEIEVDIQATSVDTGQSMRDDDLRSENFFDVAKHPTITFRSKNLELGAGEHRVTGDLTVHGTTRPITLPGHVDGPIEDPFGSGGRVGVELAGTINRRDFGLLYGTAVEGARVIVADDVRLEIAAEYTKPKEG